MEATHVGASLAGDTEQAVDDTVTMLREAPDIPADLAGLVADDGTVDEPTLAELHAWQAPALSRWRGVARPEQRASPGGPHLALRPRAADTGGQPHRQVLRELDPGGRTAGFGDVGRDLRRGSRRHDPGDLPKTRPRTTTRSYDWFSPMVLFGDRLLAQRPVPRSRPVLRARSSRTPTNGSSP